MGLLHRDCAHWTHHQCGCRRCHLVGSTVELFQSFAFHLQFHLRILFHDLRVTLAKHLSYPLIGYSSGTQSCAVRGAEVVNPKVRNLCSSKSFSPNSFECRLVPARNPIARKQKRPLTRNRHLALKCFNGERSERNLGDTVRSLRIRYPDHLSLPKTLYGANAFEINDIQEQETWTSRVRPLQCINVTLR